MAKIVEGFAVKIRVPTGAREVFAFDDELPGFGIRKFASGKASYFVKYAIGAKSRRHTLGAVVHGNLKQMRLEGSKILARAKLGQDVAEEKAAAKVKTQRLTLGEIVQKYLAARESELRPRSFLEVKRHLELHWKPLHGYAIEDIKRQDVVRIVDDLASGSGKVAADRSRTSLSTLFAWCLDRGHVDTTPVLHIKARAPGRARSRVLSEGELVEVWKACGNDQYGKIVKLLILTGQRKTEIGDLEWSELDLDDKRQITLPGERTKNKRTHIVPLSTEALAVLSQIGRIAGRDLVFGFGAGGFSGWSKAKAELDAAILDARKKADPEAKAMAPWVLHDIRRSVVTHLSENGFAPPHVVEAIVNHVSGHKAGVAGVYNHAAYANEKRHALDLWGAHVASLAEGRRADMVQLREAAGG